MMIIINVTRFTGKNIKYMYVVTYYIHFAKYL